MDTAQKGLERIGGLQFAEAIFHCPRQTVSRAMSEIFLVEAGFSLVAFLVVLLRQLELRGKWAPTQPKTASWVAD